MGFFYSGGGERTVLNQAQELQKIGHEVIVYAPTVSKECFPELQKGLNIVEFNQWAPEDLPYRSAIGMLTSSFKIPYKELQKNDVLIAHAQPSNWIAYCIRKKFGTPYIAYLHQVNRFFKPRTIDIESGWQTNDDIALLGILHKGNFALKKLDKISINSANLVLTNSNWIKQQIHDYYGVTSYVCYPGVDIEKFEYKPTRDKKIILSTNRHYPQKRIDYVLRCLKQVKEYCDDVKCVITGEYTRHTSELLKLREELDLDNDVIFTGNIPTEKLIELYENAYTYAYTSPEEDFGLGPLESGACGTPSIVWDNAGPKETVINGVTGYRIKPYDIEDMAKHHVSLLENNELRYNLGKKASKYVHKKFTWKKHCQALNNYTKYIT